MSKSRSYRKSNLSRSLQKEYLTAKIILAASVLVALLLSVSLGFRGESHSNSKITNSLASFARFVMRWEVPFNDANINEIHDARSHAGFHLSWPSRLNPPLLTLETIQAEGRDARFTEMLKIGRSQVQLQPLVQNTQQFRLKELISDNGDAHVSKKVMALLPGERILLRYQNNSISTRQWKLRVRAIAVTRDRLDSTLPLMTGFSKDTLAPSQISPKGLHFDLEIPSVTESTRRNNDLFLVQWPKDASGILIIEGLQPNYVDGGLRSSISRNLIVHLNQMRGSITDLKKTMAILDRANSETAHQIHLTHVIPPSIEFSSAQHSLLTNRNPIDLGASVQNMELKKLITPEPMTLTRVLDRAGSTRRISLKTRKDCEVECSKTETIEPSDVEFTSELNIRRIEEFSSATALIKANDFLTDPGMLYVVVDADSQKMRLNWDSVSASEFSVSRWIVAGIGSLFGISDFVLQNEERTQQIDLWLSKIVESFLSGSKSSNVAIIVHNSENPTFLSSRSIPNVRAIRGEALINHSQLDLLTEDDSNAARIETAVGLLPTMRFFEKLLTTPSNELGIETVRQQLLGESGLVTQMQESAYLTMSADGWLHDPKFSFEQDVVRTLYHSEPEKIHSIQEKSNMERRQSKLHGLHIALPAVNTKEELIEIAISTNLKGLGCESQSENAQLKTSDSMGEFSDFIQNIKIGGRRSPQSPWHLFCLLEGRMTNSTQLRLSFMLNQQPVQRELLGLTEYSLPIRGFLWRSPDTLELVGAQILDSIVSVGSPNLASTKQSIIVWSERIPSGLTNAKTTFSIKTSSTSKSSRDNIIPVAIDQLSEK